jgi:methylenetetrahydrofolate dehydrogenase (NADP+)/methenyltetrahydrofolate cyclohydrolase
MSILMSANAKPGNATVTLCHSRTADLHFYLRHADILIAALGRPDFIKGEMIKEGAVIIDVGITRVEADNEKGYRLAGDVDFESAFERASAITPVPGGVGPMTRYGLLHNTLKSYRQKTELK